MPLTPSASQRPAGEDTASAVPAGQKFATGTTPPSLAASSAITLAPASPIVTQVAPGSPPRSPTAPAVITRSTSVFASFSTTATVAVEKTEVSDRPSENLEKASVSSAAEMTDLLRSVASPAHPGESVKAVIGRAARRLGWDYGRTRRLYYGEARRIDAREMDRAREIAREREATDRAMAQEAANEFRRMGERIARLEAILLLVANQDGALADAGIASARGADRPVGGER